MAAARRQRKSGRDGPDCRGREAQPRDGIMVRGGELADEGLCAS